MPSVSSSGKSISEIFSSCSAVRSPTLNTGNPCRSFAARIPTQVENDVASRVGNQMPAALSDPIDALSAITPRGARATFEVLMARNKTMALVAVPLWGLRLSSSCMALIPKGVAALPRPSILEAIFMIMALRAGWSAGTSGNNRTMRGRSQRARVCRNPPTCTTRSMPNQKAITPTRPMASVTADLAESIEAVVTSAILPVKAAVTTEPTIRLNQIQFMGDGEAAAERLRLCYTPKSKRVQHLPVFGGHVYSFVPAGI